jgi:hypothetical protein
MAVGQTYLEKTNQLSMSLSLKIQQPSIYKKTDQLSISLSLDIKQPC